MSITVRPRPMVGPLALACLLLLAYLVPMVLMLLMANSATAQSLTDYLTPALRARVERLKADAAATPTDADNLNERTRVLWDWANAYALNGGQLPVPLTRSIALALGPTEANGDSPIVIDGYIAEMGLLDEQPDALGTVHPSGGPFTAGGFATITQTLTVGAKPIQAGGGILVARHGLQTPDHWQALDPTADNYVTIQTDASGVRFAADTGTIPGWSADADPSLVFRVASGTLTSGDKITISYGDRGQGSRGTRMPGYATAALLLPVYLAWDARSRFHSVPVEPIVISGADVAAVQAHAPSLIAPDEPFTLTISAQDVYGNRAGGGHPHWRVLLDAAPFREIPASESPVTVLRNVRLSDPGVHRFTIEGPGGEILGAANPVVVRSAPGARILWGDPLARSGFAEGTDTPAGYLQWARDDAALDFIALAESDLWLDDAEWGAVRSSVQRFNQPDEFVVFLGYQWSAANYDGGYHGVIFRSAANRNRVPVQLFPTLSRLYAGLRAAANPVDVLVISRGQSAADYRHSDPELERLVETRSDQGRFDWLADQYLANGHQLGSSGGSHRTVARDTDIPMSAGLPDSLGLSGTGGLTAVMADTATDDAVFDALRLRRTYTTSGDRIILEFNVNGHVMGERGVFAPSRSIRGRVVGTAAIDSIVVTRNGREIWRRDPQRTAGSTFDPRRLLVTFTSGSKPHHDRDNPRGWRPWHGSIEAVGSAVTGAEPFTRHAGFPWAIDRDGEHRINFVTATRGNSRSILVTLDELRRATDFTVRLQEAQEVGSPAPYHLPHRPLPATELTLRTGDLENGAVIAPVAAGAYTDYVSLRRLPAESIMDVSFTFEDQRDRHGDYYELHVVQLNGASARSSPIWIGGHPPR